MLRTYALRMSAFHPLRTLPVVGIFAAMSSEAEIVEAATSLDGLRRWEMVHRSDGFYTYTESSFISEDLTEFGAGIMKYWTPTHFSGLFHTAEEAKADALGELPWLKQLNSAA